MSEGNRTGHEGYNAISTPPTGEESMNKGYTASTRNTDQKKTSPEEYFRWAVFGITMLLLFIAAIQFYFSMQEVIGTWLEWQYVPLFKSMYNLVVIVVCVFIIKLFVFRKRA
ncbi:hypothetical protein [Methanolobus halotolerans]|uniref:DUF8060 domain-containing protein n=1 Tax=Methanolobus halotolerans TaxID=2052935 RepID=A0A4E0PV17_9EURY|nr:hypothetical protein [Methanolobus halotolerans]TGC08939.1 hypothetical protein CUN85_07855 [Methanolobus halotolerans]